MILKGCDLNDLKYQNVSVIGDKGLTIAHNLSMLFSPNELRPDKYEFINPFSMKEWGDQAPSEKLKKWVSSRIKNNIIGGATTWRRIIKEDVYKEQIKFSYNYVKEIKELTIPDAKINLFSLALWYFRFTKFEKAQSPGDLIREFVKTFNLNDKELDSFFELNVDLKLGFSQEIIEMYEIRSLIGSHKRYTETWLESKSKIEEPMAEYQIKQFKSRVMNDNPTEDKIKSLLNKYHQVILFGPPGTSKSYLADKVASQFIDKSGEDCVLKIQFHPQYSYQDFIGGFIVRGENVVSNRGIFLEFVDLAIVNDDKQYLLIIDEINRANTSSVFGEVIQCLDRDFKSQILLAGEKEEIQVPKNLFIIGTMNTADRTLGSMDFALKRRFVSIYVPPNESELIDLVEIENVSAKDLLTKINRRLRANLQNQELVIGQTIFYNQSIKDKGKFVWNKADLEDLFNYKILPMVEDYCSGDFSKISEVLDELLPKRLIGEDFTNAIIEYVK